MKCDCSAFEITMLHKYGSLRSQFFAPRADAPRGKSTLQGLYRKSIGKDRRMGSVMNWCYIGNGDILWPAINVYNTSLN